LISCWQYVADPATAASSQGGIDEGAVKVLIPSTLATYDSDLSNC
jgi:hypothetical protein